MDTLLDIGNTLKSRHGNDFKDLILIELKRLKSLGIIQGIETGKRIAATTGHHQQFLAPFLITVNNASIAIFSTTSVRSDRIKINQWDAWGIKEFHKENIRCIILLPDTLSEKEENNFKIEKARINNPKYISRIDEILKLRELEDYLLKI